MVVQTLAIARNAFLESIRQPVVLLLVLLCGIFHIFTTWNSGYSLGYTTTESAEVQSDDKVLLDVGMSTVFVMGTLLAGFIATSVISREIENKTVLTVISKPISRVAVVVGKYLGVVGTLLIATLLMVIFLMLAVRHGVMSTAADELDMPPIVFGGAALFISLSLAAWFNYFYGWNFTQSALLLLVPTMLIATLCTMLLSQKWESQPLSTDWKPQIMTACVCLGMAILVLSAVATAASTRLNQVMTILVCLGVFVGALLSNYFLGRWVFSNDSLLGRVKLVEIDDSSQSFVSDHIPLTLTLERVMPREVKPGTAVYYSNSPNGFPMLSMGSYSDLTGDLNDTALTIGAQAQSRIVAIEGSADHLRVRALGAQPVSVIRDPARGDYVFTRATKTNVPLLVTWGILPNMQFFWLLDAVSQNRPVPTEYIAMTAGYGVVQIVGFLSIAVMLFQRRDVG